MATLRDERESDEPTYEDDYLFDLRGYVLLEGALSEEEVDSLNETVDDLMAREPAEWHGYVHSGEGDNSDAASFQQIYEAEPWETLIDHPSWIEYVKHFVGDQDTFDTHHGPVFIDENFVADFPEGSGTVLHSGGHKRQTRTQFRYHDNAFHNGQINVLIALNDIGPGDGATMVVPGSHKSNFAPPDYEEMAGEKTLEDMREAREVHMDAGDALLFVDCLAHGSATRTNPGHRRIAVFRYNPSWSTFRHGYEVSDELLSRLTEEQATIVKERGRVERQVPPGHDE